MTISALASAPQPLLFLVPSLIRAGAETQVISLVNGLAAQGVAVHLATFGDNLDQLDRVDQARVRFHRLERRGRFGLTLVRDLAQLLRTYRFSAVHCTLQISLFYAWLASRLVGRSPPALLLAVHTTLNRTAREENFDRWVYRPLFRACARVIFVCQAQASYWYERFPELRGRGRVVYNGIDAQGFDPAREPVTASEAVRARLSIALAAPVVLCVARLRPEKGHELLLRAFAAATHASAAHLVLAGDGEMREAIERQIQALGLQGRVHLLGDVVSIRPLYALASITVLASTSVETFSMAMLESMAMQTPMIASDVGGLREAIEPQVTGWLTPPGDVDALRAAFDEALGHPSRTTALGVTARERVLARFTVPAMVAQTADVLGEVIQGEGGSEAANAGRK